MRHCCNQLGFSEKMSPAITEYRIKMLKSILSSILCYLDIRRPTLLYKTFLSIVPHGLQCIRAI